MLFGQLLTSIEQKFRRDDGKAYGSLGVWAEKTPVILDGRPFTFLNHEYLMAAYADNHPHVVEIKAAQMGLTTKAMLRAMYAARYRNSRGILYLFPSRTDVTEFAKGRIDPLIEDNPDTFGRWLRKADSANIKQICNPFGALAWRKPTPETGRPRRSKRTITHTAKWLTAVAGIFPATAYKLRRGKIDGST